MRAVLVRVDDGLAREGVDPVHGVDVGDGVLVAVQAPELGVHVGGELQPGLAVGVLPGLPVRVEDAAVSGVGVAVVGDGVARPGPLVLA